MSNSISKAALLGNVGGPPDELNGGGIAFSLATTERWNDRQSGAEREHTSWHRIVVFGNRAAGLAPIVRAGLRLYVEGRLRVETYDDKDGNKRRSVDVLADEIVILTPPPEGARNARAPRDGRDNPAQNEATR